LPKNGIEIDVEDPVDLTERLDIVEIAFAVLVLVTVYDLVCDHEKEFERKLGGRHRDWI
jgi:hypothetical protein